MRLASVAGQFYPSDREVLIRQMEECFSHPMGPGALPKKGDADRDIVAAVVPHAGYIYSGYEAAYVYGMLAGQKRPKTVVILGPNHRGYGSAVSVSKEDWQTPLGTAKLDQEAADHLWRNCEVIDLDEESQRYEHSIEVQVPFLQYIYDDIKFVPLCLGLQDLETAREVASCITDLDDVLVIASSDFTHYESEESAKTKDSKAIEKILDMDAKGFVEEVYRNNLTVCGFGAIATAIECAKRIGATRAELLKYGNSGDITGDRNQVVAYAGIVFRK